VERQVFTRIRVEPVIESLKLLKDIYKVPDAVYRRNLALFHDLLELHQFQQKDPGTAPWFGYLSPAVALGLLLLGLVVWNEGLKRYASTGN
jgi:hypothetical protein